jgi:Holliday junction resolvase RusA-like endonuclease
MTNANERPSLEGCPGYSPDYQAQGDCRHCGHTFDAHAKTVAGVKVAIVPPGRRRQLSLEERMDINQTSRLPGPPAPYFELGDGFVTEVPPLEPSSQHHWPPAVDLQAPPKTLDDPEGLGISKHWPNSQRTAEISASAAAEAAGTDCILEVCIPGEPMWSARMRVATIRGRGRLFEPKENAHSKKHIVDHALAEWGDAPLTELPIFLELETVWAWPDSWSKKKRERSGGWKTSRPDLDNIVKVYKDALNGVVWKDDCQVVKETVTKRYGDRPSSLLRLRIATPNEVLL